MQTNKHPRHDFLIERIAFFSDAVFAIAITLMAIEIHPPKIVRSDTAHMVWEKFREVIPEFIGLLVSFWLIGSAWLRHHQLFRYADNYNMRFMLINLWLLFVIILFPFSTGFLFNSVFDGAVSKLQVYIYLGVPMFSNLILYRMYSLVNQTHLGGKADLTFRKSHASIGAMVIAFLLAITWVMILPLKYHYFGYIFLGLIPVLSYFFTRKLKNR